MAEEPAYALPADDAANAESATRAAGDLVAQDIEARGEQAKGAALAESFRQMRQFIADRGDMPKPLRDIGWVAYLENHPSTIASLYPEFTPVFQTGLKMFEQRDKLTNELAAVAGPYLTASRQDQDHVNKLLELGRLTQQGWLGHPTDQPLTVTAPQGYQGALMQPGESETFTPEQVAMYKAYRRTMNRAFELFRLQLLRAHGLGQPGQPVSAQGVRSLAGRTQNAAERQRLLQLADKLEQLERQKVTGYVPFTRYGDVAIVVTRPDPQGGKPYVVAYERIEVGYGSSKSGRFIGRQLRSQKVGEARRRLEQQHQGADIRIYNYVPAADAEVNVRLSDLDQLATMAGADPTAYAQVRDSLNDLLKTTGIRSHFIEADNIPGYSTDFQRAMAGYVNGMANFIAQQNHREALESSAGAINARDQRMLSRYAKTYVDYIQRPSEEWQRLRGFTFFMYLGGNLSSALVNATQPWTVTFPYLSQFAPTTSVAGSLGRAYKDVGAMMSWEPGSLFPTVDYDKAPADVRDALKRAHADGLLVPTVTHEMVALSHADRISLGVTGDRMRRLGQGVFDKAIAVYSAAERANRIVTFIAAHRLAQNRKDFLPKVRGVMQDNALWQWRAAVRADVETFARHAVDDTQFRLGKVNRPVGLRGIGASVFQFTSFYLNALELMYKLGRQNGTQGAKAVGLMWGMLIVLAGWQGLPFAEDLKEMYERLNKWVTGKDIDVEQAIYDAFDEAELPAWWAEMLNRGALRQTGMDLSLRVGMGRSPARPFIELATGGQPGGISDFGMPFEITFGRISRAVEMIHQERWAEAGMEALPLFLKNPVQASVWAEEGVRTRAGQTVIPPEQISERDLALRALGFNPTRIARAREQIYAGVRAERGIEDYRRHVFVRLSQAISDEIRAREAGDRPGVERARERQERIIVEVADHNQRSRPEQMILLDRPSTRTAIRRRVRQNLEGAAARRTRAQARDRLEEIRQSRPE